MNKTELIDALATKADVSKAQAEKVLNALIETVTETLADSGSVTLVGFGSFGVKARPARTGRNPSTGKAIEIAASNKPSFTAGKSLKDACNR
jgi:DNA-binding protein HU-beta